MEAPLRGRPRPAPKPWRARGVALALLALLAAPRAIARAEDAGAKPVDARRAKVAVRIGETAVTVGEIEDRLAEIPPFQRRLFGPTPETQVKAYVEQVLVRDALLAEGAKQKNLASQLPTSQHILRSRSSAVLRGLRRELPSPAAVPEADVKRYYEENKIKFDSPERVHVWRLLARTRDEAETLLAAAKKEPTTAKWTDLAREKSIDKATSMRGGNLGFLAPDGTSNEAGVSVDAAVVKAARAVKDGEMVDHPVAEGEHFAVVWRRGSVPETKRPLEEASAQIRTTLFRERTEAAERKLIAELRAAKVREVNIELLGTVDLGAADAGFMAPRVLGRPAASSR